MISKERVEEVLDKVRIILRRDGGNVELVDITEDNVVKVRLQGACSGCPMSQMTLKMGVERTLRNEIPEIKDVIQVVD